jgi:LytS/YehU family sensor histidine kinase
MIIEKASQSEIALHEELIRLNYYLDLERERFKGKFDFHIGC